LGQLHTSLRVCLSTAFWCHNILVCMHLL
jgi:hypothetical protein